MAISLLLGLIGLWIGSNIAVFGAQKIARKLQISETVIGLTVVSIGTSLAEIATSVSTGLNVLKGIDASEIAVGTIIGSCLAQITIVLGTVGLLTTFYTSHKSLKRDGTVMILATLALFVAAIDLKISRLEGSLLAVSYLAYLGYVLSQEKVFVTERKDQDHFKLLLSAGVTFVGLGLVALSADFALDNALAMASALQVRPTLVGIIMGLGTTLPEFTVSLMAIMRGSHGISLGSMIGSNITDPLLSIGLGASIAGFTVLPQTIIFDFPLWIVGTVIALLLLHNNTINLTKMESGILIIFYILFLYIQFFIFGPSGAALQMAG